MLSTLGTLVPYVIRYRWRYLAGFSSLAIKGLLAALVPILLKVAVDRLSDGGGVREVAWVAAGLAAIALAKAVFQFWMRWILIGISRDIEYDLRNDLTARLLRLPQRFYRSYRTGDLMSRAVNDLAAVRLLLGPGLMYSADVVLTFAVVLTVMAATDWRLTCLVFLPIPLVSLTVSYFGRKTHDRFQKAQEKLSELTALTQENLSNMRIVRAYAQNAAEVDRFAHLNGAYRDENLRLVALWRRFYPQLELLIGLTYVAVLGFGGIQVIDGRITVGSFVMFMSYMAILTWPMIGFGWVVNLVQRGTASLERLNEVLSYPTTIEDGPETDASLQSVRGDLRLRQVSLVYPGAERPTLDGVDLDAPAGRTIAIVGAVGAGKTTLLNVVPRLLEPTAGDVLIDGTPITRFPLDTLRGAIGYVPQESFLFSRSIRDNLLLGAPGAEDWQLEEAAAIASVWDDIQSFPAGLDTLVGERGVTLSGGQKQRVCLARALLRDPRILILDDALSSVDAVTEAAILENLSRFMRNRTTLIVSHRVSAAQFADSVGVLHAGRIAEFGSHAELLDLNGRYAELYRRQQLEEELVGDG